MNNLGNNKNIPRKSSKWDIIVKLSPNIPERGDTISYITATTPQPQKTF